MMPMSSSSSSINSLNSSSSINSMNSSSGNLGPKRTTNEDNLNFPGQWRFSQCFGDKTETLEVAEGMENFYLTSRRYYFRIVVQPEWEFHGFRGSGGTSGFV